MPPVYAARGWSDEDVRLLNLEVCGADAGVPAFSAVRVLDPEADALSTARSVMRMIRETPSAVDGKIYLVVSTRRDATHFVRVHTDGASVDGTVHSTSGFPRRRVPPDDDKAAVLQMVLSECVDYIIITGIAYDHVRGVCADLVTPQLARFPRFFPGVSMAACGALPWIATSGAPIAVVDSITLENNRVWRPHIEVQAPLYYIGLTAQHAELVDVATGTRVAASPIPGVRDPAGTADVLRGLVRRRVF